MSPKSTQSVLIVDDQPECRAALEALLANQGHDVLTATDARDAIAKAKATNPDLILSDVMMPGMSGFDLCRHLRAQPELADVPVVLVTVLDDRESRLQGLEAGADDFISKPFDSLELRARVRTILRLNRYRRLRALNAELEERVRQRTTELERVNRELETFAYSVSHELRAPVRAIHGFSRILREDYGPNLDSEGHRVLGRVQAAATRMERLIEALLDLSRVARVELRRETVDLSALAREITAELREAEPKRAVEVVIRPGVTVNGDARLLRSALANLFANAWKFTVKCSQARVELGLEESVDGQIILFLRDNGVGFDTRHTQRLFTAFGRLHSRAEFPGTGLGLTNVQRIIHRHGGRIWADAEVEKGSVFRFTIPAS